MPEPDFVFSRCWGTFRLPLQVRLSPFRSRPSLASQPGQQTFRSVGRTRRRSVDAAEGWRLELYDVSPAGHAKTILETSGDPIDGGLPVNRPWAFVPRSCAPREVLVKFSDSEGRELLQGAPRLSAGEP
jgi:hypothetical protein